jgi:16S rRNA (guanine(1405)-N(7))-methyltransferase
MKSHDQLDMVIASVRASPKYRAVSPDLVREVAARELAKRPGANAKEAIKATKNKLHQIAGVYLDVKPDYDAWLAEIARAAAQGAPAALRTACRDVLRHHASTRERLPILDQFYAATLARIPPPRRVLDLACGLNPLALPWLPLAPGATYTAYDIYADLADFLAASFEHLRAAGLPLAATDAAVRDILHDPPQEPADLALLLKAIPCLEQIDPDAGRRLLHTLNATHLLVSYPVASLGGRGKGMAVTYEARFHALVADTPWTIQRYAFPTELAFIITK